MSDKTRTASKTATKQELVKYAEERNVVKFIDTAMRKSREQLPALDAEATRLILTVFRVSDAVKYDLEASVQRPAGLSSPGFHLMWIVWLAGAVEASVAATMMGVSRATVSGISATLEKSEFLSRTQSSADGRAIVLELTRAGKKLFEKVFTATNDHYVSLTGCLSAAESKTLVALLGKIANSGDISRHRS